ncbi:MAG: hypothetical protein K5739_03790 [Lachnospiraceae bacterium]|nr:hypothetical protein [Lachnospiraceae bacterium]
MQRTRKTIITMIIVFGVCIMPGISGCGNMKSEKIDALKNEGYAIEQVDENSILITEDGTEYYFKSGITKPVFEKAVVKMPSKKTNAKPGQEVEITIAKENMGRMTVVYTSPCNLKDAAGNETVQSESMIFKFKKDFTRENLTNNKGFADIGGNYDYFTSTYMTAEDLSAVYNRGLELAEIF